MKRLPTLIKKETLQIMRDSSAILIAFVLPLILLFIFGYGVNLDSTKVRIGVVLEDRTPSITSLATSFTNSKFFEVQIGNDRREFYKQLTAGKIRGIIIIPQDFSADGLLQNGAAKLQIITDGSEPNTANFVNGYTNGVVQNWLKHQYRDHGIQHTNSIQVKERYWYNPELKSRNFLVPGSMAIIMTLIGTLLTALVIAREWERGTMESIMATPVSIIEILLGKLIPYYLLGIGSMFICLIVATLYYEVPFRGSIIALFLSTTVFMAGALGQGLLISSVAKNQFVASQGAIMSAFLPAFMLSGFIFEISAMPQPIQWLTYIFPARYYVTSLQTLFLAGNVWPLLLSSMATMGIIGVILFVLTGRKTIKRLDV